MISVLGSKILLDLLMFGKKLQIEFGALTYRGVFDLFKLFSRRAAK